MNREKKEGKDLIVVWNIAGKRIPTKVKMIACGTGLLKKKGSNPKE